MPDRLSPARIWYLSLRGVTMIQLTDEQASVLKQGHPARVCTRARWGRRHRSGGSEGKHGVGAPRNARRDPRESVPIETQPAISGFRDEGESLLIRPLEIYLFEKGEFDVASETIGRLDATRLRDFIKAIGDVIDPDCEPN
jgi:hypothetical protein